MGVVPEQPKPKPPLKEDERCDVGAGCVPAWAIWVIVILAVTATVLDLYGLWAIWPDPTTTKSVRLVLFTHGFTATAEQQMLALVALAGALGGLVHFLRSFGRYVGNRQLLWSWVTHYALIPVTAAAASTIFYIVTRAGLLATNPPAQQGTSAVASINPFGFAAVGALVGLFTEEAMQMLKKTAKTIFSEPEKAEDSLKPPPDTPQNPPR